MNKEEAKVFLEKKFDWKYYGGHHLENRMTAFFHSVYAPKNLILILEIILWLH
jgi:hypothetical protein